MTLTTSTRSRQPIAQASNNASLLLQTIPQHSYQLMVNQVLHCPTVEILRVFLLVAKC